MDMNLFKKLNQLSNNPEFKLACKNEDVNKIEQLLVQAQIIVPLESNGRTISRAGWYYTNLYVVAEAVAAGVVAAVANFVVVMPSVNSSEYSLHSPVLQNILKMISKFSNQNFTHEMLKHFNRIESNSFSKSYS
ncbi:hypothetical protein [Enterococcus faecium]|uniref:Uncharacterized protein n=1 Tax=Enterococcus faecium TaxID=1352 RepID=A0A242BGK0_ENTFC|nr:hypothetical protein [Enterococcus faecium]OTN94617.1 hypothetical protein A5810_000861 [Enterococcus faecium]